MHLIIPTRWLGLYETKQRQLLLVKTQMGKMKAALLPLHNSVQVRILTQYGKAGSSALHSHSSMFCVFTLRI